MSKTNETYQGHPVEDIVEGEKIMTSPVTGTDYLVTKWVDKGDGRCIALEKELLESEDYDE